MPGQITVIGLGSGDNQQLSLGAWRIMESAGNLYLRTEAHPVAGWLKEQGIAFQTFDRLYTASGQFAEVYENIAAELIALAEGSGAEIVYAVPGHPSVAEYTVRILREICPRHGVHLRISGGMSFLDQAFAAFGVDPIDGFVLLDGSRFEAARVDPAMHIFVAQIYDVFTASDVKLGLMEHYPDDYPVVVGHALGVRGEERLQEIPLFELDRVQGYGNLSVLWVPRAEDDSVHHRSFRKLREIVALLRSPGGCPWDREQTHESLRKYLLEEMAEVLETIDGDDPEAMCEELGDLLLQVMLHAQIGAEEGLFDIHDVIEQLNRKLIRRHPHVFGDVQARSVAEVAEIWQEIKRKEKDLRD